MPNQFKTVARAVIQRIAMDNPGHQELTEDDIKVEFIAVFPDASGQLRAQMMSKIFGTHREYGARKDQPCALRLHSGERLCLEVFPVIWPHTAEQI